MPGAPRPHLLEDLSLLVALSVADASRWLGWWAMRVLVVWGSALCGLSASVDCPAEPPRPRALRHDLSLRREVRRGLAELDAYLLTRDATRPSDQVRRRTRRAGGDG